jgi:hypothetical protein
MGAGKTLYLPHCLCRDACTRLLLVIMLFFRASSAYTNAWAVEQGKKIMMTSTSTAQTMRRNTFLNIWIARGDNMTFEPISHLTPHTDYLLVVDVSLVAYTPQQDTARQWVTIAFSDFATQDASDWLSEASQDVSRHRVYLPTSLAIDSDSPHSAGRVEGTVVVDLDRARRTDANALQDTESFTVLQLNRADILHL